MLEGQHGLQPLAVLLVHGLDQLQRDGLGQVADQVGQVVELHVLGGGQQFVGVHALDERLAHVFAELDEHVAFDFRLDEVPDHLALRGRQRFHERAISAGCIAAIMRAAPRHEPSRNAPRNAARRRSLRGMTVLSAISGGSVDGLLGNGDASGGCACPSDRTRTGLSSLFAGPFVQCGIASLLAAATRDDVLVRLERTMAKSPYEAGRRLRASTIAGPGPLAHLLCVYARWGADVIAPRPISPLSWRREEAHGEVFPHHGATRRFPGERARLVSVRSSDGVHAGMSERAGSCTSLGTKPISASSGLFADVQLQPHEDVFACVGGQQSGDTKLNKGPGESESSLHGRRRSTSISRGASPFASKWGVSPITLEEAPASVGARVMERISPSELWRMATTG